MPPDTAGVQPPKWRFFSDLSETNFEFDFFNYTDEGAEHLEKELEAAQRAGRRQAAPFAKGRPQGSGGRPGRRSGAEYGKQGRRRPPARVDETHAAPAPTIPSGSTSGNPPASAACRSRS